MKRTPLKRTTPLRSRRPTPRNRKTVVRLRGGELIILRIQCWLRDGRNCVDCGEETVWNPRFDGDPQAYDMAHIQSRGAGGSDVIENVKTLCHKCHMKEHALGGRNDDFE